MKEKCRTQVKILQGKSAEDLETKMNKILQKQTDAKTQIDLSTLRAFIMYEELVQICENVKEEMEASGEYEHCGNCPHFEPTLTVSGEVDGRTTRGVCGLGVYQNVDGRATACLRRYQRIASGMEERSGK